MLLHEYETIVLIKADIGDEPLNKLAQRVKGIVEAEGGKFLSLANWGKKKLAYEIDKHQKAVYLYSLYLGKPSLPIELERQLGINDDVIRYMTIALADRVDPTTRESKEIEPLKVTAESEEEEYTRRDDSDSEFGPIGDDFDGGFDEENL